MKHGWATMPAMLLLVFFLASCASTVYVPTPPPEPRHEAIPPKPGEGRVWIKGHWNWNGGRYVWVDGKWAERSEEGEWVDGRWEKRPHGWVWLPGHYR